MLSAESLAAALTPPSKVNILLVDDQPENLLALEALLEDLGQNLVKARSGSEALWHLLREDFALVLTDVQMPEMDGFELAALLRQRERSRLTPIIFMTAAEKSETQIFRGYEVGAVDYILKPIVPAILKSKVAVFVELARKTETILKQTELLRAAEQREHQRQLESALAFSRAVSHDLRAPLRHIESYADLLLRNYAERLDATGADYLRRLNGAAHKMTQLIDAMVKLTEATRCDLTRELVDMTRVAAAVAADLRRAQPGRRVSFSVQEGLTAMGDPHLLRLMLENLLGNAWKFTGRREDAVISVGELEQDGTTVFFVRDNGAGFDMKAIDKLFAPFSRLHARGEFEGTGMGLATVRRIVDRHGGRIWAEAEVDRGASFYFTLPFEAAEKVETLAAAHHS
jgi:signal transduction histidine kinase